MRLRSHTQRRGFSESYHTCFQEMGMEEPMVKEVKRSCIVQMLKNISEVLWSKLGFLFQKHTAGTLERRRVGKVACLY